MTTQPDPHFCAACGVAFPEPSLWPELRLDTREKDHELVERIIEGRGLVLVRRWREYAVEHWAAFEYQELPLVFCIDEDPDA
jgi:hypothetical protein